MLLATLILLVACGGGDGFEEDVTTKKPKVTTAEPAMTTTAPVTTAPVTTNPHYAVTEWTAEDGVHYHACADGCGIRYDEAACGGGEATCSTYPICAICGEEYGERRPHVYTDGLCTYCGAPTPSEGLVYRLLGNDTYEVSGIGSCTDTKLVIPDIYNGKTVTSIGGWAFWDCSSLTTVTIGDSVKSIGYYAFSGCTKLVEVRNLSNRTITKGSYNNGYIGYYALDIYTDETTPSKIFETEDGYFFYEDGETCYLLGYTGSETDLTLPADCHGKEYEIYRYAFEDCSSLTSVTIGDSVTSIGSGAFEDCDRLTTVTIGDSVTSIGDRAFEDCDSLTTVTIPDSVKSIGIYAFAYCDSLTRVTIPDSVTSIGEMAFYGCTALESITLPFVGATKGGTSNTHFGYIFGASSCNYNDYYVPTSLKTVVITGGTSIGSYAFWGCDNLTSVTIGDSVASIGSGAFSGCSSLTSVNFENTVGWTAGSAALSATELADTATAATYLRSTYYDYAWTRK